MTDVAAAPASNPARVDGGHDGPCWSHALIVALVVVAALAPFANKPLHIDDPMYVWAAQQIREHPLDFYGFDVHWYQTYLPMPTVMKNPPLGSYFIALVSLATGWSDFWLHVAFLIPAIGLAVGTYVLASRLCPQPLLATIMAVLSPVYLVCASSVMCDVPMVCLWIWAMVFWERGLRGRGVWNFMVAGVLIGLCALTKYYGAALIPLLAAWSIAQTRRAGAWVAALVIPLIMIAGYEMWTARLYGRGLFIDAFRYPAIASEDRPQTPLVLRGLMGCSFLGGCMIAPLFLAPWLCRLAQLFAALIAVAFLMILGIAIGSFGSLRLANGGQPVWLPLIQSSLFVATGAGILLLTVQDLARRRDAGSVMLACWVVGTFVFVTFVNWSITARTLLPLAPAVAIIVVRLLDEQRRASAAPLRGGSFVGVSMAAIVGLAALWGDYAEARSARVAAERVADLAQRNSASLWFQGHWGFQEYLQRRDARPLDFVHPQVMVGDLLATPPGGLWEVPTNIGMVNDRFESPASSWVSTWNQPLGAGFHSNMHGPLPYAFGRVPAGTYVVHRIRSRVQFVGRDVTGTQSPSKP